MPNLVERLATFGAAPRRVRLMPSISNASVPEVPTIGQVKRYVLRQTAFGDGAAGTRQRGPEIGIEICTIMHGDGK